ncbi:MAG: DEAD/DEAH box helicase, partial [Chitinophagaceae bacterium]|nr:DEAD/DEAH box helicase [Chitinophagaceae bacterium]
MLKTDLHTPHSILQKYWQYQQFRPLQEEIILHVLEGKDTLAVLPTGAGKSICYQIPALLMPGACLVVSPLIALMKDQVLGLKKRGIDAMAVYTGMGREEGVMVYR